MSKKIVCIGSMSLDITCIAREKLNMGGKNPNAMVLVDAGGVTRNSGEVLARMGHDVAIVSTVGVDDFGKTAINLCEDIGMDMTYVSRVEGGKTTASIQMIDYDGEVAVMAADVSDEGDVSLEQVKAAHDVISQAGVILVCPTLGVETIAYIFETYKDIPKFMDACALQFIEKIRPFLKGVHTLKVNEEEAAALVGFELKDEKSIWNALGALKAMGPQNIVVTLGSRGAIFSNDLYGNLFPAKWVDKVANATGAGDSFFAGLVHGFLEDLPVDQTMEVAGACSRLTIMSPHTISTEITRDAVYKEAGLK